MRLVLLTLAVFVASIPAVPAQQSRKKFKVLPGRGIDWKGNWEEALKEAEARNVPVMLCVHMDG